jgi:hypothetical protein
MRGPERVLSLAALIAVAAVMLAGASSAVAQNYCGFDPGSFGSCTGAYQALTKNSTVAQTSSWTVCSGALDSSNNFYGQYFCASDWSCHTYGGGNLTPISHNHEGFGQTIYGQTGAEAIFTCPRGGPVSRAASADSAGSGSQCLTVRDGPAGDGITCADQDAVAARGLAGVLVAATATGAELPATATLYAIAPDGARYATLNRSDGASSRLAVTGGRIEAALHGDETTLQWDTHVTAPSAPAALAVPLP